MKLYKGMKKLAALISTFGYFLSAKIVFAADTAIKITKPANGGYDKIDDFLGNIVTIGLTLGMIAVLIMLVWGAFEWIISGGDKEAVGKARSKIINALIGLAVMAVAFALAKVGAGIAGINLDSLVIPGPK